MVEHDRHVALTLSDGLTCLPNCEVTISATGDDALEILKNRPCDLLITDYKMPGTNGLALITRVQKLYPETAVLMITAHRDDVLAQEYASGRIHLILDKPVELETIRSVVSQALGQRAPPRALQTDPGRRLTSSRQHCTCRREGPLGGSRRGLTICLTSL